jgi:hypothetical protein
MGENWKSKIVTTDVTDDWRSCSGRQQKQKEECKQDDPGSENIGAM